MTTIVEYYNKALDHYFISLDSAEIDNLDRGRLPGWARTGLGFGAMMTAAAGTQPVCRFYLPPGSGDSHFFSASAVECAETQTKFPQLVLETSSSFHIALPDAEIVNDPYVSSVGDKINIYKSSGTAAAPIDIHDNFALGGYGIFPLEPQYSGGVITDGSKDDSGDGATAFVTIHHNQFVNAPNFGAQIGAGHDNEAYANRSVSTGRLANGEWMAAPYGNGFVVWNGYGQSSRGFANNVARDNVAGWVVQLTDNAGARVPPAVRHDYYLPDCARANGASLCVNNASLPDAITPDVEATEYVLWQQKLRDSAITLGPAPP